MTFSQPLHVRVYCREIVQSGDVGVALFCENLLRILAYAQAVLPVHRQQM